MSKLITCKVGNTIINCMDDEYSKHKLKTWSNENRLICPDCGKLYEYCHGDIVSPYFRHKEKSIECDSIFREPETDEHIKGKVALYKWLLRIKDECGLENIHLEYYIKETRQKPDVYFEQNGERYVIEYQCTPIATEFLKRRELYKLVGIKDIWVLGTEKYTGTKAIESHIKTKFNAFTGEFIFGSISKLLTHKRFTPYLNNRQSKELVCFQNGSFNIDKAVTESIRHEHVVAMINRYLLQKEQAKMSIRKNEYYNNISTVVGVSNGLVIGVMEIPKMKIIKKPTFNSPYNYKIEMNGMCGDKYVLFIKDTVIDVCEDREVKYGRYKNLSSKTFSLKTMQDVLFDTIIEVSNVIEERYNTEKINSQRTLDKFKNIYGDLLDEEILLINGKHKFNNKNVRFKFLKGFNVNNSYFEKDFLDELKFLKNRNAKYNLFMIPKYHNYFNPMGFSGYVSVFIFEDLIIDIFRDYRFKNVRFVDENYFTKKED